MKSYAKRVDANHANIVLNLRRVPGCTVMDLSAVGAGCPDIAVGFRGKNYFMEIKDGRKPPSRRKLTAAQVAWIGEWTGQVSVVKSVDDVWSVLQI